MSTPRPTPFWLAVWRLLLRVLVIAYVVAVVASNLVDVERKPHHALRSCENLSKNIEYTDAGGRAQQAHLAAWGFGGWQDPTELRTPVVLLHGCPGSASDFLRLAPLLAADGRRVLLVDLPGFGTSERRVRDYSMRSFASAVGELLGTLGIDRVHAVGWSNSGGVVLHMAEQQPELVSSITLLAAVGDQRYEGSGSYHVEHLKYAVAGTLGVYGPFLVPHFGALGDRDWRLACARFFADSDQRPLVGIMERLRTPTLVLHGRDDFLVPLRAAERHHQLIAPSTLVVLDANHFIPFTHAMDASREITGFVAGVEMGQPLERARQDPRPREPAAGPARAVSSVRRAMVAAPWVVQLLAIAALAWFFPRLALLGACALIVGVDVDWFVAALGLAIARGTRVAVGVFRGPLRASPGYWKRAIGTRAVLAGFDAGAVPETLASSLRGAWHSGASRSHRGYFAAGAMLAWTLRSAIFFVSGWILTAWMLPRYASESSWQGLALTLCVVVGGVWVATRLPTAPGRCSLRASIGRAMHHEYWPAWAYYPPVVAWALLLAARHRSLLTPFACNPGIGNGGGIVGESKSQIMHALGESPLVLRTVMIPAGNPDERVAAVVASGLAFPVILKPDAGQRGYAVKLARTEADVLGYFRSMTGPAVAQPYHPGPLECGVFWVRSVGPDGELLERGEILSVTAKEFPFVTGDGERTLEQLIDRHPRHRKQRETFLARLGERCFDVPARGERVPLAVSGNHCQGTLFRDGARMITPALNDAISRLSLGFAGGFDFGRFDIRYESDEALRRGEGFAVVELNGITSESTNCYDPARGVFWSWGVLMKQWSRAFAIGAARRKAGARTITLREIPRMLRAHYAERTGNAVAD